VMRRAGEEARLGYGRLLIKLVDDSPAANRVFPSAVPAVGSKQGMKRRILSIKNRGRTGLLGPLATGVASVAVVCATFTGASEHASWAAQGIAPATNVITATNGAIVHFGQAVLSANNLTIDLDTGQVLAKGSPLIRWPLQSGDQPWIGEHSPSGEQRMSSITNSITVSNGVVVHFGRSVLTARRMTINPETGQVLAEGWRLQTSGQLWTGEHLDFNFKTNDLRVSPDQSSR
jgi:lipopolysaccharide export system protein LptA